MSATEQQAAKASWLARAAVRLAIGLYCIAIYLVLDAVYSHFFEPRGQSLRLYSPDFHHGLVAKADGWDLWGEQHYRLTTNSLGMKDASTRDVPLRFAGKRIVLIGDSFTEGLGLPFAETFAGLLYRAGQERREKIEFLNAGVVSYSPVLYYRKIKYLLERGVVFDEVVVLSDLSDVYDEATHYFCFDDEARYKARCGSGDADDFSSAANFFQRNFVISDRLRVLIKLKVQSWTGNQKRKALEATTQAAWTIPNYDVGDFYAPLGVEAGVARSLGNMRRLSDLLASRGIPLTIVVYPWPLQLSRGDAESRQVTLWRDFCAKNCKAFVDLFPAVFAAKAANPDWYERFFITGDVHYSAAGNSLLYRALAPHLLGR